MNELLKKLNFKAQKKIVILNEPEEFKVFSEDFKNYTEIQNNFTDNEKVDFAIIFVREFSEVDSALGIINGKLGENAVLWFSYPKKSSKKYKSDIARDPLWEKFGKIGMTGVRMIAIDDDWSSMRFKKAE